jgi:hypothetical protein
MRRLALLAVLAAAVAGCGLGAGGSKDTNVTLTITRDFGEHGLESATATSIPADETVMRLLEGRYDVTTRYGGGFVQSIEGLEGSGSRQQDWFYYVNGIEASDGAAQHKVSPGDRIWWDFHDWSATMRVPAVVGSYPEPFVSGSGGKRIPVRIDCAEGSQRLCDEVARRLQEAGVKAAPQAAIGAEAGKDTLRVVVGPWVKVREDPVAVLLERGPKVSGVFAVPHGDAIDLLSPKGHVVRTLHDAGGLVAATRYQDQAPTWVVTGTDDAGVAAAASALDEGVLSDRFAVAIDQGLSYALPVPPVP